MKKYNVKNLKPVIMEFASTLPPVDKKSAHLNNALTEITDTVASFRAITKDGKNHEVDFVGNWGRLYLGHQNGKVDLDKIDMIYAY